jgi:hypothetical protein
MGYRAGALAGLIGVLALGQAAAADPTGTWHCQFANQPANRSPIDTYMYQFDLQLSPDGQGFAQGTYYAQSAGYNEPFQAQGQWTEISGHVGLQFQATAMKQSGPAPFALLLRYADDSNMMFRNTTAFGSVVEACQR